MPDMRLKRGLLNIKENFNSNRASTLHQANAYDCMFLITL